jgi:hypothetical protein
MYSRSVVIWLFHVLLLPLQAVLQYSCIGNERHMATESVVTSS